MHFVTVFTERGGSCSVEGIKLNIYIRVGEKYEQRENIHKMAAAVQL